MVRAVIEKEFFIQVTGAEMAAQHGQHPVFGFNFAAQHTAQIGETDKAL